MNERSRQQTWRKSILGSSPQTTILFKMSMNISYYNCCAVLFQEATIARHPNNQIQTKGFEKEKKKKITISVLLLFQLQTQSQWVCVNCF